MDEKTILQFIDSLANTDSSRNRELFIATLKRVHPTVRQTFTGMCLGWINEHAADKSGDKRIKASRDTCYQIVECYRLITDAQRLPDNFPMV